MEPVVAAAVVALDVVVAAVDVAGQVVAEDSAGQVAGVDVAMAGVDVAVAVAMVSGEAGVSENVSAGSAAWGNVTATWQAGLLVPSPRHRRP